MDRAMAYARTTRKQLDELTKRVQGISELEARIAKLEKQVASLSKETSSSKRSPARKAPPTAVPVNRSPELDEVRRLLFPRLDRGRGLGEDRACLRTCRRPAQARGDRGVRAARAELAAGASAARGPSARAARARSAPASFPAARRRARPAAAKALRRSRRRRAGPPPSDAAGALPRYVFGSVSIRSRFVRSPISSTSKRPSSGCASGQIFIPPPRYGPLATITSCMRPLRTFSSTVTRTSPTCQRANTLSVASR